MAKNIIAVLLSGGTSTRFWPLKDKNTFIFQGKEFLYWHYQQLVSVGIKNCIVVVNDNTHDSIRSIGIPEGLTVNYIVQKGQGMGQAVASLDGKLHDEPILILGASEYYSDAFMTRYLRESEGNNEMMIGAVKVSTHYPGGYLRFNADKTVSEIIEKPKKGTEPSDMVTVIADYFPQAILIIDAVKTFSNDSIGGYEKALSKIISNGSICRAETVRQSDWCPIKYPWHVLSVMNMLLDQMKTQSIHPSVEIKKNVVIEGPVIIEEGVKIFEGTKIVGPVYIGKNTIIGNNNIIRQSHIGASVVTGFSTDITRSYIGDNCWFHTNYIGDSVIGNNVSMGSGTVCANLRLDDEEISSVVKGEKIGTGKNKLGAMIGNNVRIGVNTSIMPGIKIGQNSFIGAGIVIDLDVEDGKFVFLKNGVLTTVDNTKQTAVPREEFQKGL